MLENKKIGKFQCQKISYFILHPKQSIEEIFEKLLNLQLKTASAIKFTGAHFRLKLVTSLNAHKVKLIFSTCQKSRSTLGIKGDCLCRVDPSLIFQLFNLTFLLEYVLQLTGTSYNFSFRYSNHCLFSFDSHTLSVDYEP
jgi:hypothetical protein